MKPRTLPVSPSNIMASPLVEVAVRGMARLQKAGGEEYLLQLPPHALFPGLLEQEQGCHQHQAPEQGQLLLRPGSSLTWI